MDFKRDGVPLPWDHPENVYFREMLEQEETEKLRLAGKDGKGGGGGAGIGGIGKAKKKLLVGSKSVKTKEAVDGGGGKKDLKAAGLKVKSAAKMGKK